MMMSSPVNILGIKTTLKQLFFKVEERIKYKRFKVEKLTKKQFLQWFYLIPLRVDVNFSLRHGWRVNGG